MRDVVLFAVHTGLRAGEIAKLKWHHVDLKRGFIVLKETKAGKDETVPTSAAVRGLLTRRLNRDNVPPEWRERHVFADAGKNLNGRFWTLLRGRGIEDAGFYTLRHTFASLMAQDGVPLPVVKELMRHRNIAMTMRYACLAPSHTVNAVESLAKIPQEGAPPEDEDRMETVSQTEGSAQPLEFKAVNAP